MSTASLNAVGVIDMPPLSHIVKAKARTKYHNSAKVKSYSQSHNVNMAKERIPNQLRAWREFRRMTQEELAAKADTTASQISMLESGERGLTHKWALKLAPILKTQPGHLFDTDPESLDSDIHDIWINIDKRDRAKALRVLKSFTDSDTGTHG
jgi:transcriptional regulator with XRE-family HTH domain